MLCASSQCVEDVLMNPGFGLKAWHKLRRGFHEVVFDGLKGHGVILDQQLNDRRRHTRAKLAQQFMAPSCVHLALPPAL